MMEVWAISVEVGDDLEGVSVEVNAGCGDLAMVCGWLKRWRFRGGFDGG